jgi:hypothetical protein
MQNSPDDHHVVERLRVSETAGGLDEHATTCRHGDLPAGHDRPLHVQGPAPISFIRGQPKVIDENREGGEREMLSENNADA